MIASTLKLITLFLCLTIITAFTSPNPLYVAGRVSSAPTANFMAPPLEEVSDGEDASAEPLEEPKDVNFVRNYGRGGEFKEVKWVDPAMSANTNPLVMDFWAYPLVLFPFVLLADDVFHFLPDSLKEGFLKNI